MKIFNQINPENKSIALIDENNKKVSYSNLFELRNKFSSFFKKRSLTLFLTSNSIDSIIIYLSLLKAKSVPILIESNTDKEFIKNLIKQYEPDYLLCPSNFSFELDGYTQIYKSNNYIFFQTKNNIENIGFNDELAVLMSTSGSTGSPKLVRISYNNIYSNTDSICKYFNLKKNDKAITILPMSYSFGLSVINTHLFVGGSIFICNKSIVEKKFWNYMNNFKITFFYGVPFTFEVLEKIKFFDMQLPYLSIVSQAGGKLNDRLIELFSKDSIKKKRNFFVMYGQTEATARISYIDSENILNKVGSIGMPISGGKFSIVDEYQNVIQKPDVKGELVYEGPNVSLGYANNKKDLNKGDTNKGRLFTGDLAYYDKDGYYYIVGRKKRFIKLFGNRVNLDEVENILKNEGIECACNGSDDKLKIYITSESVNINNLTKNISKKIKIHPSTIKIILIDKIPKNNSGKIDYRNLK